MKSKLSNKFYSYTNSAYGNEPKPESPSYNPGHSNTKMETNMKNSSKSGEYGLSSGQKESEGKQELDHVRSQIEKLKQELKVN